MPDTHFTGTPLKATTHVNQNEGLIFEKSSPGKKAWRLAELDVPAIDASQLLGAAARPRAQWEAGPMPELSEIEIIRHFTRLSTWNYAIDLGMYPLGSCTMKYNPRINEAVARLEGIADAHPYQPEALAQGCLGIMQLLSQCLIEITGMDAITLQPAAGAHGEFTGILLARAYHEANGNPRKKVLIPDSAHGTNPATAAVVGYQVANLKSNSQGMVDLAELTRMVDNDTAALMLTNPSTIGVFESDIHKIADILHAKGALLYMDGANMNALCGKTRPGDFGVDVMHLNLHKTFSTPHGGGGPGSGPVACKKILSPFLPTPVLVTRGQDENAALSSRLRPPPNRRPRPRLLRQLRHVRPRPRLHPRQRARRPPPDHRGRRPQRQLPPRQDSPDTFDLPYSAPSMHEVVFSDKLQAQRKDGQPGVKTGDMGKRLIDYGFHAYTVSFPLVVSGAMMIEPTESESREELDLLVDALQQIAREAAENPELVRTAPHSTRLRRLDETTAARKPILRWKAPATTNDSPAANGSLTPDSPAKEW